MWDGARRNGPPVTVEWREDSQPADRKGCGGGGQDGWRVWPWGHGSGVTGRDGGGRWPEGLEGWGADLEWGWRQVRTARRKQDSE